MNTLYDVRKSVISLLGWEGSGQADPDYTDPKINEAYQDCYLYIKANVSGSYLEQLVEIPNATDANGNSTTQGLTSLAAFQQQGKPLCGLYEPLFVWWKQAGQPESCYTLAYEKKTLPFYQPQYTGWQGPMFFSWRANQLFVTPMVFAVDLLIDGRFNPPPLVKDTDPLVVDPDFKTPVVKATIAHISNFDVGNGAMGQTAMSLAENALDNIVTKIQKSMQGYTARAGTAAQRRLNCGIGWNWWGGV